MQSNQTNPIIKPPKKKTIF